MPDAENPVKKKEERKYVEFDGPADSVYLNVPDRLVLEVGTGQISSHLLHLSMRYFELQCAGFHEPRARCRC